MGKKLYEFKKGFINYKVGDIVSLTEEQASVLKDYVVEHISKEQRLKNLKLEVINKLQKIIFYIESNRYQLALELLKEHDSEFSTIEYIDFKEIVEKTIGIEINASIGDVIRILAGGI